MADDNGASGAPGTEQNHDGKSDQAFRTISEVAGDLDVPQHVLRFWETKFTQVKPMKRGGGRRYYRPDDVALLRRIRDLLYTEGFTIRGAQRLLRQKGARALIDEVERGPAEAAASPEPVQAVAPQPAEAVAPVIETVIDPSGIGPEAREQLKIVLEEMIALREELREDKAAG